MATSAANVRSGISAGAGVPATPPTAKFKWIVLLVLGAGIIPYVRALRFGFVYDDNVQVLAIPAIRLWSYVPAYFFRPIPGVVVRYYRPIFFLWFRLNYFLWNTDAWGWHLANVALHAAACVLVLLILRKYFKEVTCAAAGALVFAAHPAHIETVAWVSGCTDSLMGVGLLASLWLWMKNCEAPTLARRVGSLFCCALALLTKETAIILPIVIGLHAFFGISAARQERHPIGNRLRLGLWEAAPYAGLTAVYLGVRSWVLKGIPGTPNWVTHMQSLLTIPPLFLFYVRHLFWPVKLSIFYDFPIVDRPGSHLFWLPLLALALIAGGAWLWFRRSEDMRIVMAGLWMVLPVAPVVYIRMFQADEFVHDRYLYLPVLALSILTGMLCKFLWKGDARQKVFAFPTVIVGLVVIFLALETVVQAEPWKSNLSLYTHAIQVAPKNTMARNNLASEFAAEGRFQEASEMLKALLEDSPRMWLANYNYGYVNYRLGNLTTAEDYLRRAIHIDAGDADQYVFLGTTYLKEGRLAEAAEQVRQGIARKPAGFGYHFTLGVIEVQRGNVAAARKEMQEELKYHPENADRVAQGQALIERMPQSKP